MERDGIIERSPNPDHGRKSLVKLTARGRRLSDVISAAAHDVQKVASKGLTTAELDEFYCLVDLMTENLSLIRGAYSYRARIPTERIEMLRDPPRRIAVDIRARMWAAGERAAV